ncbi:hypothetical protein STAS_05366 [Striga asiatica]|uniref:Uncharacterized protein n=1 Tax=Striga asiatica TaxID=4170 RepID=A0A5A7PAQ6_STRAF|nr:hypothetical protein STAS_05366 [Striga asiatica]
MGFSKTHQIEANKESEGKKWVIVGVAVRAPLKPIATKAREDNSDNGDTCPTTPTARESKLPEKFSCPPAPRKRRPSSNCNFNGVREFFNPPDLESVFLCHAEREN